MKPAPPTRTTSIFDDEDLRHSLQRRTVITLCVSQVPGRAAVAASVVVVTLIGRDLLGSDRLAGVGGAAYTIGAAVAAVPLASAMRRRGRRKVLARAFLLGAMGSLIVIVGTQVRSIVVFVLGLLVFGAGQAGALLERYVATDLARPHERAQAVAQIIWVGALGAVIGPLATPLSKAAAIRLGLNELTGPYLLAAGLFLAAGAIITIWLRPDPLMIAGGMSVDMRRSHPLHDLRVSASCILSSPLAVLGLSAMTVSQATMVAVMMMTPPHMDDHGHADLSAMVIAVHIFGMFGLAPFVGRLVGRIGSVVAIQWGAFVLGSGTVMAVIAGYVQTLLFLGLFLLGLGWSIGLVAGSTLLTSSVPEGSRVSAQGTGDFTMSFWGATAALGSGFIKTSLGFHMLANLATAAAAVLLIYAWVVGARQLSRYRGLPSTRTSSSV